MFVFVFCFGYICIDLVYFIESFFCVINGNVCKCIVSCKLISVRSIVSTCLVIASSCVRCCAAAAYVPCLVMLNYLCMEESVYMTIHTASLVFRGRSLTICVSPEHFVF